MCWLEDLIESDFHFILNKKAGTLLSFTSRACSLLITSCHRFPFHYHQLHLRAGLLSYLFKGQELRTWYFILEL